ncbi:MAG: hypothetical protein KL787_04320, partial [Taibaiella sp.]|nr:hypothetical protein [Taibaiella sp.]
MKNHYPFLIGLITFVFPVFLLHGQHLCQPSPYQSWWDALHYDLSLDFHLEEKRYDGVVILKAVVTDTAANQI